MYAIGQKGEWAFGWDPACWSHHFMGPQRGGVNTTTRRRTSRGRYGSKACGKTASMRAGIWRAKRPAQGTETMDACRSESRYIAGTFEGDKSSRPCCGAALLYFV